MELLAPAGNLENYHAAMEAGADAVYVGAPGINARNLSRDLRFEEIWAMIEHAHDRGRKLYLAANSLILERDIDSLIETLSLLESLKPDALIVQDLGVIRLLRNHFPSLKIHASTLMGACNSHGVEALATLGCERVVLARELTLREIGIVAKKAAAELEVFVHGAMCYSFSGLCLFSSFLGGKSGLRGRCVQPCRRAYSWRGQGGKKKTSSERGGKYLFSMNDMAGFDAVEKLRKIGISSIKIEGRLRSANYVGKIVEAYRTVLDAGEEDRDGSMRTAYRLAEEAMGRRTSTGYFFSPQPKEAITPHHSGNMGLHLGGLTLASESSEGVMGTITPKYALATGDRLRLHREDSGERKGFTLHRMYSHGNVIDSVRAGQSVQIDVPRKVATGVSGRMDLFKVDHATEHTARGFLEGEIASASEEVKRLRGQKRKFILTLRRQLGTDGESRGAKSSKGGGEKKRSSKKGGGRGVEFWLRTDSIKLLKSRLPFKPDFFLINMNRRTLAEAASVKRELGKRSRNVIWALPPLIFEKDINRWKKQIQLLVRSGFRSFQVGHISQLALFDAKKLRLYGDYTLNVANSQALATLSTLGFEGCQAAIELDRKALVHFMESARNETDAGRGSLRRLGLTVHGTPPLFTARLGSDHFQFNRTFVSPKGEQFQIIKQEGLVYTVPIKPFSLLPHKGQLQEMGIDYMIVDTSFMRLNERTLKELGQHISGTGTIKKLPTLNYMGYLE